MQFSCLLALMLAQVPLSFYQRFVEYGKKLHTGDFVTGTLTTSSALSMVLICGIGAVVVLYVRRVIGPAHYVMHRWAPVRSNND